MPNKCTASSDSNFQEARVKDGREIFRRKTRHTSRSPLAWWTCRDSFIKFSFSSHGTQESFSTDVEGILDMTTALLYCRKLSRTCNLPCSLCRSGGWRWKFPEMPLHVVHLRPINKI